MKRPERLSQTLLRVFDKCPQSAAFYLRGDGAPSHEMSFGTAFHAFAERAMVELIRRGEPSLYAPAEGEDPVHAARSVASLTGAMVGEILRERSELVVPVAHRSHSRDHLRECAYHWAIGCDVDPATVVGVEQKFVLDLACGVTISGKLDLAALPDARTAAVKDYKTSFNVPSQGDLEDGLQLKLYAALLCFGQPVERIGTEERRLPGFGEYIESVDAAEVYPRYVDDDRRLRERGMRLSRQQIVDFRHDLEDLAGRVIEAFDSGEWPAVPGSQCNECANPAACPIPAEQRRHAGTINSLEQAVEAAVWWDRAKAEVAATQKELKGFAKNHGPIPYGTDRVLEFADPQTSHETDWPGLMLAVDDAVQYGEPFNWSDHRKQRVSTPFRSRRLTAEELAAEANHETEVQDGERDFGDDPPF